MTKATTDGPTKLYVTKKCPECYEYVPLEAKVCPSCKLRLGEVDHHGMARRLTNWGAYIICGLLWLAFIIYIKWAFF
ncbi:MAG: zinc ribbon domain-containing protein [Desulfatitalea sp.]|nr:zinc ribbon domain-containing protein [Desulfatitalea sp.]